MRTMFVINDITKKKRKIVRGWLGTNLAGRAWIVRHCQFVAGRTADILRGVMVRGGRNSLYVRSIRVILHIFSIFVNILDGIVDGALKEERP